MTFIKMHSSRASLTPEGSQDKQRSKGSMHYNPVHALYWSQPSQSHTTHSTVAGQIYWEYS